MITLEPIAKLTVSAASGCVIVDDVVHVVADDDVSLCSYSLDGTPRGVVRLFDDVMPAEAKARKKVKPDLEALTLLPNGKLLAIGSGSSDVRNRAVVISGTLKSIVDASALFARLSSEISELNIEGVAVHDGMLVLAQRGNGAKRENALIRLKLSEELLSPGSLISIERIQLGELDGVPLSITDLAVGPGGVLHFSAAAEDTDDPYLDGECAGSVIGAFEPGTTRVAWTRPISEVVKIEGLAWHRDADWYLVADADDPTVRAPLFRTKIPAD